MSKSKSYKLSIITINFNNLLGLKRTVESVINQTWKEFEYIIIDGGSTDGSAEYIQEMQEHFQYWVSERDKGIYNAMNKGISVAKANYIQFLNSGDVFFNSDTVEKVTREIVLEGKHRTGYIGSTKEMDKLVAHEPPEIISLSYLFKTALPHQGMFFPRECFSKIIYNEDYKIASDWILCVELLLAGFKFQTFRYVDLVAINENYGASSSMLYHEERKDYITKHPEIFDGIGELFEIRRSYKNLLAVKKANLANRLIWRFMRKISGK